MNLAWSENAKLQLAEELEKSGKEQLKPESYC